MSMHPSTSKPHLLSNPFILIYRVDVPKEYDYLYLRRQQNRKFALDYLIQGQVFETSKDYLNAMKKYIAAIETDSECLEARIAKAELYDLPWFARLIPRLMKMDKYEDAIFEMKRAREIDAFNESVEKCYETIARRLDEIHEEKTSIERGEFVLVSFK